MSNIRPQHSARYAMQPKTPQTVYLFESLDGTGFTATLPLDDSGLVTDCPQLFRRVNQAS